MPFYMGQILKCLLFGFSNFQKEISHFIEFLLAGQPSFVDSRSLNSGAAPKISCLGEFIGYFHKPVIWMVGMSLLQKGRINKPETAPACSYFFLHPHQLSQ